LGHIFQEAGRVHYIIYNTIIFCALEN